MLHRVYIPELLTGGVSTGIARGPPAAEEVPELVEADLELTELLALGVTEAASVRVVAELVLALDQRLDPILDALIRISGDHGARMTEPSTGLR